MALNHISTATNGPYAADTKIYRRALKLALAQTKRQAVGTPGYRVLNQLVGTHSAYVNGGEGGGGFLETLSGTASPTVGHPWSTGTAATLVLSLDAGNPASYSGTGTTWTDTVGSIPFTLYGGPTYSASNGGYLTFVPGSSQYAQSNTGPGLLAKWTVEVWHYYTGTNGAGNPCLLSERFTAGKINYCMGSVDGNFQTGFFNGGWHLTPVYTLTANNWYHLVGTYDGTDIKLYLNGTLVETTNAPGQTVGASNSGINLMRRWDNPDLWGGRLSVVRIYDDAISQTLVTSHFNTEKSRYGL